MCTKFHACIIKGAKLSEYFTYLPDYQEELVHAISEWSVTSTIRTHFLEQLTDILLPDEKHSVLSLDSVAVFTKTFRGARRAHIRR